MKKFYVLALAALAVIGATILSNVSTIVADYSPRDAAEEVNTGAPMPMEYWVKLVGNNETGKIEPTDRARAKAAMDKQFGKEGSQKSSTMAWSSMGPDNIGGRTRAILAYNNNLIFAGSASGGLFKSTNAGNNWSKVVSCKAQYCSAIVKTGNGDIYLATGSAFEGASNGQGGSSFPGSGLYRSTDQGDSWSIVEGTENTNFSNSGDWAFIDGLAADANQDDRVWIGNAAGLGYYDSGDNDLNHISNGGTQLSGLSNGRCGQVEMSPDGSMMLAVVSDELNRSTDGGATWEEIGNSDMNSSGRLEMALAPSNPDYMYALKANGGGSLRDAYYSTDGGDTWIDMWPNSDEYDLFGSNGQGGYDNVVIVDPNNEEEAYFGGVTLWKAGSVLQPQQIALNFAPPFSPLYVHSDIHEFEWDQNGVLYIGCDGGVFKSFDQGQSFVAASKGYVTTQFYGMDYSPFDAVSGGTQDNGSILIPNDGSLITDTQGIRVQGGDGYDSEMSQVTTLGTTARITTSQYGNLTRTDGVGDIGGFFDDELLALQEENNGEIGSFYTTFHMMENTEDFDSERFVIYVNPLDSTQDVSGQTIELLTENLNLDFDYTFPSGTVLQYWDMLVRPEIVSNVNDSYLEEYFWLDPQSLTETIPNCDTLSQDSVGFDLDLIITPIDTCIILSGQQDSVFCFTIGFDTTEVITIEYEFNVECPDTTFIFAADTLLDVRERIKITDPYTNVFAFGLTGSEGVWMTREAFDFNTTPDWWRLGTVSGNAETKELEVSKDCDWLWYSTWNGRLVRIDISDVWDASAAAAVEQEIIISSAGGVISGIEIDPNDPDHMVIAIAGYGSGAGVRETFNATAPSPTWNEIFNPGGDLDRIPVFEVLIESINDPSGNTILAGTEFGVFITTDGGENWDECNDGQMERVPVFDVRQQWRANQPYINPENTGNIYLGTHGRGFFKSDVWLGINEDLADEPTRANPFKVYPNPAQYQATIELSLDQNTFVDVAVYDINGRRVQQVPMQNLVAGQHQIILDTSNLPNGNYVVAVVAEDRVMSSQLVVFR